MTCAEFENALPDFLDGGGGTDLRSHAASCDACSELVSSLQAIMTGAKTLQGAEEPSPRVWNSIESALRREGLIHEPRPARSWHLPSFSRRWGAWAWAVPVLGALLLAGLWLNNPRPAGDRVAAVPAQAVPVKATAPVKAVVAVSPDDQQMMQEVAVRAPMMTAIYQTNLARVNQYIQDAQAVVDANPTDDEAQRSLMEAYEQKSLLNEIALDRSLP